MLNLFCLIFGHYECLEDLEKISRGELKVGDFIRCERCKKPLFRIERIEKLEENK